MKKALITGITGQDGSYLAELLLSKGYEVHGIIRRSSSFNTARLDHIYQDPHVNDRHLFLHYGDMTDSLAIDRIMNEVKPQEIYHLAAQSHVHVSFDIPKYTGEVDALGTLYVLEAMRNHVPNAKLYNATTSELYGKVLEIPQKETTPFNPRSPYGVAKLYSYHIVKNYREAYYLYAVNGILFNHESERRGSTFVTKKITEGLIKYVKTGRPFYLGNVYAKRDWGYAPDFVEGMWMMLQQDKPEDFVLATGETHTIKEFVDESLYFIPDRRFEWAKDRFLRECLWEVFPDESTKLVIGIDDKYYRPAEVDLLLGDATKAKEKLGWEPKTKFKDLVKKMMLNELNSI
ncbi:MAG TPA: GDP-mannose 4,6-dehydratase [Candidatus Paceibacterota bacterium]|nr:GDP-mannose 4,6-dehydratase [Candidatus Paceibacterota bacterium]